MFKLVHLYVISMAAIFGTVMLQAHFDGLVLTASPSDLTCYINACHLWCQESLMLDS
jgi:hypothetical protein